MSFPNAETAYDRERVHTIGPFDLPGDAIHFRDNTLKVKNPDATFRVCVISPPDDFSGDCNG